MAAVRVLSKPFWHLLKPAFRHYRLCPKRGDMIDTCRACGSLYDDMGHCEDCESYFNQVEECEYEEPEYVVVVCDSCGWSAKVLSDYTPICRAGCGGNMHEVAVCSA